MPILLGDDGESGCGSEDDILINIDAEAEELAREEEEEAAGQARIKEISRELEESSVQAGLLSLPPIAYILPSRGKGRVVDNTTAVTPGGTPVPGGSFTPGGTSVPEGSSAPVSTAVPGTPVTSLGAPAPRIRSTPGGASAPGGSVAPASGIIHGHSSALGGAFCGTWRRICTRMCHGPWRYICTGGSTQGIDGQRSDCQEDPWRYICARR